MVGLEVADGMFVQPGTQALSITDLSTVWLIVDVFERDMARLTDDMRATARFEHLPGQTFEGTIDYVYPELDPKTRTLPVRLRFDNSDGQLRPNMFGTVSLVPSQSRVALTVPSEAIIRTGTAERVILKTGDGTFMPRLVTTGLRDNFGGGGRTEIIQGLAPGEEVVASAQFLIDSESALNAGLMRMAPTAEAPARGSGELLAIDEASRMVTIRHDALESLDWPAMTSRFPLRVDVPIGRLTVGQQVAFRAARGSDGLLGLVELASDDGIAATGTGMVMAVTADGKLKLSHDPIADLGWPAMEMDMAVDGFDPSGVPLDQPIEFDLSKGADGLFTVVAVRNKGMPTASETTMAKPTQMASKEAMAPHFTVSGTIEAVDEVARMATIQHGPMIEIGMPGMTMDFQLDPDLEPSSLAIGEEMNLTFARPDGMTMILSATAPIATPMEVSGTINTVDAEAGTANITHGPMTEIGMPGMTMDFAIDGSVDPASLPLGTQVMLQLRRNPDFSMTLLGVRNEDIVQ